MKRETLGNIYPNIESNHTNLSDIKQSKPGFTFQIMCEFTYFILR